MNTGYVNIKGPEFNNWIESEFQHVSKHVQKVKVSSNEEQPINIKSAQNKVDNSKNDLSNTKKDIAQELTKEGVELWEENRKLKNALTTIQETLKQKNHSCHNEISEHRVKQMIDEEIAKLEHTYDKKVTTFTEVLENQFRTELKEAKRTMNNKIANLRDEFIKLKTAFEDESNGIFYQLQNTEYTSLKESIAILQTRIDEIMKPIDREIGHPVTEYTGEENVATNDIGTDNIDKTSKPANHANVNTQNESSSDILNAPLPCIPMVNPIPTCKINPNVLESQPPFPPKPTTKIQTHLPTKYH